MNYSLTFCGGFLNAAAGMYFSCSGKKSTKRSRHRRGAECRAHLRAKSRLRRLRSETRLRAQPRRKTPSPMYLSRRALGFPVDLNGQSQKEFRAKRRRRLRSRRPAALDCTTGDGAGGFLRGTRVERELGLAPLSRLLWGTFLAETRKVRMFYVCNKH